MPHVTSLQQIDAIYRSAPIGLCVLDRELRYVRINECLANINGLPAAEHIGRTVRELLPHIADLIEPALRRALQGDSIEELEIVGQQDRSGRRRSVLMHSSPILDKDGTAVTGINIVVEDITDRKEAEERLRSVESEQRMLISAVDRANRTKDQFIATLAHELRQPLGAIAMAAGLLRAKSENRRDRAWDVVERQLQLAIRLLDDLLDLSRIERGKVAFCRERLDLRDIVQSAVDVAAHLVSERRQRLHVAVPTAAVTVLGDRERLQQVVSNLLNNASKFTPTGGNIAVSLTVEASRAIVSVRDSGRGIPPAHFETIFEPFAQAEHTTGGGLGIGLAVVRQLVERHGGRVEAHSAGEGRGSEFTVTLPLAEPAALSSPGRPSGSEQAKEIGVHPSGNLS